ncbi:hypothetical protein PF010_g19133 [Phytophthora fragariae]|uniref:Uncharacterized protein n=1 Tax=Phytophthora fragariae TaxID=53985 RepID=A0A6G0KJ30_9STRA|nr:hypothetical protein PF010_g19133 [Phytophthora fragariae]
MALEPRILRVLSASDRLLVFLGLPALSQAKPRSTTRPSASFTTRFRDTLKLCCLVHS